MPIRLEDVRLVYPLPNPETGILEDTIIAELETVKVYYDRETGNRGWKRAIKGDLDTIIPWPRYDSKPEPVEHPSDTRRLDVERRTFNPTLLAPPFPSPIIDELRNKYSVFRTRHEEPYLAKLLQKEADKGRPMVRTPLQELNRKIRLEKKALGPPVLAEDVLERIGRVMAQNKPALLEKIPQAREAQKAATV